MRTPLVIVVTEVKPGRFKVQRVVGEKNQVFAKANKQRGMEYLVELVVKDWIKPYNTEPIEACADPEECPE